MELEKQLITVLDNVFSWSKKQDFSGHNKHDGLNSALLHLLFGWSKWSRICAIQFIMRSPVNLRPFLGVSKTINPKGLGLFVLGLLDREKMDPGKGFLSEAENLLNLLLSIRSKGRWTGSSWGYPYPWQDLGFYALPHTPNAVVTCFVCEAFLEAFRLTGNEKYLSVVGESIEFFCNDLTVLYENEGKLCLAYMPMPMTMRVMDVSILIGAVIAQYAKLTGQRHLVAIARKLVRFVVDKQTDYHAWFYTDPPEDSLIRHDNYHTGFILDALWRYMAATGEWDWRENYERGLKFYAEKLFNDDGSPRWMSDKNFPHDVHGAAQGLISFSIAVRNGYNYKELLGKIADWALTHLYNNNGRFYYQHCWWGVKKFTLLRWCNAWMFRGLASLRTIDMSGDQK